MSQESTNQSQSNTRIMPKINKIKFWLSSELYVEVDEQGFCAGECFEGALGFVIKLHDATTGGYYALKFPKLIGDTVRENAYICDLMEKEASAVKYLFSNQGHGNLKVQGLLNTLIVPSFGILRDFIRNIRDEKLDNSIVLVHYEKAKNPQFCLLKKELDRVTIFPEQVYFPIQGLNIYEELEKQIKENLKSFIESPGKPKNTIFIEINQQLANAQAEKKCQIYSTQDLETSKAQLWFACVPSVIYGWAPGTLQEAISTNQRGNWHIDEHLKLIEMLCMGLDSLHMANMIHGDLRPANVVFQGNAQDPNNYSLSDYGSYAQTGNQEIEGQTTSNQNQGGPIFSGERKSAFYAPERLGGTEREAADTAIIIKENNKADFFTVILGWRSQFIVNNIIDINQINQYSNYSLTANSNKEQKSLQLGLRSGDRIKIRDYIFELNSDELNIEEKQILCCKSKIWKIYHNKIAISTNVALEFQNTYQWFSIPRTTELLQWSAASDLYSLGALALYSVYTGYKYKQINSEIQKESNNNSKKHRIDIEEEFRDMLTYLGSPPYFRAIWPEIESLRRNLEEKITNQDTTTTPEELINSEYCQYQGNDNTYSQQNQSEFVKSASEYDTIKDAVIGITRLITQTVPGVDHLVASMDYDLGRFIFFIHFVLCCLHRESHLSNYEPWMQEKPFAKDRTEQAKINGAAHKALMRLRHLQYDIFGKTQFLDILKVTEEAIPQFNPTPDTTLRVKLEHLKGKLEQTKKDVKGLRVDLFHRNKKAEIIKMLEQPDEA